MLSRSTGIVNGFPSSNKFKKNNTKTVDIGFQSELTSHGIFGSTVAICAHNPGGNVCFITNRPQFCKSKIREFRVESFVKKNVG
ncbi:hypothetical protein HanRHA438_Chr06g0261631 [Helianthus annuus]|nr:hypothetical protein HanRHA438_Chr06g0261631 [Helianthus annuus]